MDQIRNSEWESDTDLRDDLQRYILENLSRREVLDFVKRDYVQYAWSLDQICKL